MNNLSQYEQPQNNNNIVINDDNINKDVITAGYASADDAVPQNSARNRDRERKRGSNLINLFNPLTLFCLIDSLV